MAFAVADEETTLLVVDEEVRDVMVLLLVLIIGIARAELARAAKRKENETRMFML